MHITPGRSLRKSLGMGLQFMSLVVRVQYVFVSCSKSVYFDIAQKLLPYDYSWVYHVEQDGSSYPNFSSKDACHRNPVSS